MESEKQTFSTSNQGKAEQLSPDMLPENYGNQQHLDNIDAGLGFDQWNNARQEKLNYIQTLHSSEDGAVFKKSESATVLTPEDSPFDNRSEVYIPTETKRKLGSNILAKFGIHR